MLTPKFARITAAAVLASCITSTTAYSAAMAYDDASKPVYVSANAWNEGQNGGFGFEPWDMQFDSNPGDTGTLYISSQGNGGGTGNIDSTTVLGGRAWGLFARNFTNQSAAVRQFTPGGVTGDRTLGIGEQFRVKFDNGYVDTYGGTGAGIVGFGLQNSAGHNRFEFFLVGGNPATNTYTLNIANNVQTIHTETYAGMTLLFTLTGPDTFKLDITYGQGTPITETFTGDLEGDSGSGIDRFRAFDFQAGPSGRNVFYNNIEVIPEPSSLGLLAACALGFARRRSRK